MAQVAPQQRLGTPSNQASQRYEVNQTFDGRVFRKDQNVWAYDKAFADLFGMPEKHIDAVQGGVISVFRESSTKLPRPSLTSSSAGVCGIPKVFECGASLDRLDEPSRPPPLAGPGVAGSVAVRY